MSSGASSAGGAITAGAYVLDTSVFIRSLRGDTAIASRIASAPQVYVSSTVLGELYYDGAYGSPTRPDAAVADVETIERAVAILLSDSMTARIYAQIKLDLKKRGLTIPDNDLWIAAIAIQYDVTLAAHDAHFDWIGGLRVEKW